MTREVFFRRLAKIAKGRQFYLTDNSMVRVNETSVHGYGQRVCPIEALADTGPATVDTAARHLRLSSALKARIMDAADYEVTGLSRRKRQQDRKRMLQAVGLA